MPIKELWIKIPTKETTGDILADVVFAAYVWNWENETWTYRSLSGGISTIPTPLVTELVIAPGIIRGFESGTYNDYADIDYLSTEEVYAQDKTTGNATTLMGYMREYTPSTGAVTCRYVVDGINPYVPTKGALLCPQSAVLEREASDFVATDWRGAMYAVDIDAIKFVRELRFKNFVAPQGTEHGIVVPTVVLKKQLAIGVMENVPMLYSTLTGIFHCTEPTRTFGVAITGQTPGLTWQFEGYVVDYDVVSRY